MKNEKTLREIMHDSIKSYGWLSFYYERGDHNARNFSNYEDWLKSLNDEDFYYEYLSTKESCDNLD